MIIRVVIEDRQGNIKEIHIQKSKPIAIIQFLKEIKPFANPDFRIKEFFCDDPLVCQILYKEGVIPS